MDDTFSVSPCSLYFLVKMCPAVIMSCLMDRHSDESAPWIEGEEDTQQQPCQRVGQIVKPRESARDEILYGVHDGDGSLCDADCGKEYYEMSESFHPTRAPSMRQFVFCIDIYECRKGSQSGVCHAQVEVIPENKEEPYQRTVCRRYRHTSESHWREFSSLPSACGVSCCLDYELQLR